MAQRLDSQRKLFNKLSMRYNRKKQETQKQFPCSSNYSSPNAFDYSSDSDNHNATNCIKHQRLDVSKGNNLAQSQAISNIRFSDSDTDEPLPSTSNCQLVFDTSLPNCDIELPEIISEAPFTSDTNGHLEDQIAKWCFKHNITQSALQDLLKILREHNFDLPKDPRTLLKTPRKACNDIQKIEPGLYYHFGLENACKNLINRQVLQTNRDVLELFINIDGLPLSESSGSEFYPIQINSKTNKDVVEVCGLYHGNKKPNNVNQFLNTFVMESQELLRNGFMHKNKQYFIRILGFICDVPAKSFIKCTTGHSGYYSCSKCNIKGTYVDQVCFPDHENFFNIPDIDCTRKHLDATYTTKNLNAGNSSTQRSLVGELKAQPKTYCKYTYIIIK